MDSIPLELLAHILVMTASSVPKNDALELRLVCKPFNAVLKPIICETLNLDVSRLSRLSGRKLPSGDALQTIGYHCKALYIDLLILRDECEVELLPSVVRNTTAMMNFCRLLQTRYCLNHRTFTQEEYSGKVAELLFNCRNIEHIRLTLPVPLIGRHSDVATWMLAITFRALSQRPEEDSARLRTLVLENVTDKAVCKLWHNPVDVRNIMFVLEELQHLVISTRRREPNRETHEIFSTCLWDIVRHAENLDSLCMIGMETMPLAPPQYVKRTDPARTSGDQWRVLALPDPTFPLFCLQKLELCKVDLHGDFFDAVAQGFGQSLRELYLNGVALKVWANPGGAFPCHNLWVGVPYEDQKEGYRWVAPTIRRHFKKLEICRAKNLGYDVYGSEAAVREFRNFDLDDPCGLGRSLAQRFVEVVSGFEQPALTDGRPFRLHPGVSSEELPGQVPRPEDFGFVDWETSAHQTRKGNSTSRWLKSLDGRYANRNDHTIEELYRIAQTACNGMGVGNPDAEEDNEGERRVDPETGFI